MLTDDIRAILDKTYFAVLATINADGTPHQTVMWFELIGDRILMNTEAGRLKESNIQRDPRVSICIEDHYNYVTLTGTATLDYDPERAQADIARLARRYQPSDKAEQLVANFQTETRITMWIDIEHVITKF
jgi:PPOX class probable F420-dependent enzyme